MNIKKKTLVILTPGFPENEEDSTCLPLQQDLVRSLFDNFQDLDIKVLTFQYPYHKKEYSWFGIPVLPFGGRNKAGISKLLLRKKIIAALKAINASSKVTGILSFWYGECALVGKRFSDILGTKHYCWILGQDAKKDNKYPDRVHLKSNELIALSDFVQEEFEKNHGTRPAHLVPPGLDPGQFISVSQEKEIDILAAGSLIPLKQFDLLIDIISEIRKSYPGLKAILAGNGPEKNKLQNRIKNLGLESSMALAGEISREQLIKLMKKTRVFLHPSSYEGFGMVCLEAISAGAHTISFVKPMKEEIQRWHVVKTSSEMSMTALGLLNNYAPATGVTTGFDIKQTAQKMMQLFMNQIGESIS